jgi:hypothetical protein
MSDKEQIVTEAATVLANLPFTLAKLAEDIRDLKKSLDAGACQQK